MESIGWPEDATELAAVQRRLARAHPRPLQAHGRLAVGASAVCFARGVSDPPGDAGEPGWGAASRKEPGSRAIVSVVEGRSTAAYQPGLLALREGPLRQQAVEALPARPEVVIVDATGRDHPRRAGLALHLGALLDLPTVGATDRPLAAVLEQPEEQRGSTAPLWLAGELVGYACRTRTGSRPVCVSAGWRTTPELAAAVVLAAATRARTPQPLREARRAARAARGQVGG